MIDRILSLSQRKCALISFCLRLQKYDEDKVNDFHYEFAEEYTNNAHQLVYCLKVGIICAAKTSKGWQRCRILKLHDKNTCDALLFDIGRKERVNWNDLRMLNGKWIDIKPLASRCSLVSVNSAHSIDRFTLQQQQAFTEILQTQSEFYVFVNRPDVISSDVFLYYKCDNHFYCVNEVFPSESSTDDSSVDETETSMRVGIRTPAAEMSSQPKEIFHIGRFETTSSMPQSEQQFVQKTTKEISHVGRFETTLLMPQSEQQKIEQNIEPKIEQNNQQQFNQQIEQQNGNSIGNGKEPSHELQKNEKVDQNGVVKHANGHTNVSEVEVEDQEDESQYSVPQLDRLLSKPEPVVVKHIEGINEIHICFEKYLSGLSRLRFDIQKYVQHISTAKAEPQQNWKVGDSCLVFDSFDGYSEWLRGTIVSINGLEKCGVYLRDVGKTIESPVNNLKPINDDLHRVRDFTWKMKLSYIKMEKGCPLETANELLYDLVCSYDKVAISALHENDNKDWGIILWGIKRGSQVLLPERFTYVNINEELVKNKVATTRVQFDGINHLINDLVNKKPLEYEESEDIQKTTQNYEVTDEIMEVKQWLPSDPIFKREFAAFPMYVSQNCVLTVLEANRKTTAEELQSILDMKGQAKELVRRDSLEWKKEDACFARFNGDKKFYRATVRRVNFERNSCVVSIQNFSIFHHLITNLFSMSNISTNLN